MYQDLLESQIRRCNRQIRTVTLIHWGRAGSVDNIFDVTLTGYAFETIPGKAIITGATKGPDDIEPNASFGMPTPEPATLGAPAGSSWTVDPAAEGNGTRRRLSSSITPARISVSSHARTT